ncbi:MurR/RpiR family transcriptional regulator [Mesorhizobium sp. Cs1321R2N1]|uniref:MurR/RpiR family transcriptional regulator n=1 Tax=Mesorhizobium sp. Cs1321R2N1 TaxID=3015174 RepID=UPI00301E37D4
MHHVGTTFVASQGYGPPSDLWALKEDIAARRIVLPGQFEKIGRYALANPEEIAFGTSRQIAASVGASQSTVSRFVRALGFEEFGEFRGIFRSYLRDRKSKV